MKSQELKNRVDPFEAPAGFIALRKDSAPTANACQSCEARSLCQKNTDNWCLTNRCMSFDIVAFSDGKIHRRNDGQSVYFIRVPQV